MHASLQLSLKTEECLLVSLLLLRSYEMSPPRRDYEDKSRLLWTSFFQIPIQSPLSNSGIGTSNASVLFKSQACTLGARGLLQLCSPGFPIVARSYILPGFISHTNFFFLATSEQTASKVSSCRLLLTENILSAAFKLQAINMFHRTVFSQALEMRLHFSASPKEV